MDGRLQVFSAGANRPLAGAIVNDLGIPLGRALVGAFRNGETRVRIEENVRGSDVFIVQPMCSPVNQHLMDLLIMIDAVRRSSAGRITAVIPYYAYAKQEKKTVGREPISAKLVANLLVTAGVDRVLTVDLHAPAIEGFFDIPVDHLRAAPILANYIKREGFQELVVVSPDAGGVARADDFRSRIGGGLAIFSKMRHAPDTAAMLDMVGEVSGKTAIIIDDMISTGGTLISSSREAQANAPGVDTLSGAVGATAGIMRRGSASAAGGNDAARITFGSWDGCSPSDLGRRRAPFFDLPERLFLLIVPLLAFQWPSSGIPS